jgi:hypothetical protein
MGSSWDSRPGCVRMSTTHCDLKQVPYSHGNSVFSTVKEGGTGQFPRSTLALDSNERSPGVQSSIPAPSQPVGAPREGEGRFLLEGTH